MHARNAEAEVKAAKLCSVVSFEVALSLINSAAEYYARLSHSNNPYYILLVMELPIATQNARRRTGKNMVEIVLESMCN